MDEGIYQVSIKTTITRIYFIRGHSASEATSGVYSGRGWIQDEVTEEELRTKRIAFYVDQIEKDLRAYEESEATARGDDYPGGNPHD